MKKVAILAFCLTSSWSAVSFAQDAAPPADAATASDAGGCTVTAMNDQYGGNCSYCRSDVPDGGFASCRDRASQQKGVVCTRTDPGNVTVEVWCTPAAVTTAKPSGCSVQTAGGPVPFGALAALGGLGIVLARRRRYR